MENIWCDLEFEKYREDGICILRCRNCSGVALVPKSHKDKDLHRKCGDPTLKQITEAGYIGWLAQHGTGSHLHKLIEKLTGEDIELGCNCIGHITEMNQQGPQWCRKNTDEITGWMLKEIDRRLKEPEIIKQQIKGLEHQLQTAIETRDSIQCTDGRCQRRVEKVSNKVEKIEKQLELLAKYNKPLGWMLKFAGKDLPGRKLAIKGLILRAVKLAKRDEKNCPYNKDKENKNEH